ncbi:hypothetical protein [Caballeronia sp. J97]|uniref:hypothetical protein n=1 Tax=Caballeronia sp. J97 TaxID=2805429 RepID=UPI002AB13D9B|nr:hypothetical protein [Caballeronia sp. J97]
MKKRSNWFCGGAQAQFGNDVSGIARCMAIALAAIAIAMAHRLLGYEFAHEGLRAWEAGIWTALPSTLEHVLAAFGVLSLPVLPVCWTKPTTRQRMLACVIGGVAYFLLTTLGWDYQQYRATHDPAQLAQMAGDVVGIVSAAYWLTRARVVDSLYRLA